MSEYRTISGYDRKAERKLTRAMEDYLEMVCRYCKEHAYIRINQLANQLHVAPSSASKMAEQLKDQKLIEYEKYGYIRPTAMGWELGGYFLERHEILQRFLCMINDSDDELEQTELTEHFFDQRTILNMKKWLEKNK